MGIQQPGPGTEMAEDCRAVLTRSETIKVRPPKPRSRRAVRAWDVRRAIQVQ